MKTLLYFVRHGEVINPEKIWYGRLPRFALSLAGKKEIEQTAEFLSKQNIDFIYSSPLLRTRQTAQIINNKLRLPKIYYSKYLLEAHSSMQGQKFSDLVKLDYDVYVKPHEKIKGETIRELAKRMQKFISKVIKIHKGKHILVVSHGDPIMMVRTIVKNLPIENASLRPGPENYVKHGEVFLVKYGNNDIEIESIFKPKQT